MGHGIFIDCPLRDPCTNRHDRWARIARVGYCLALAESYVAYSLSLLTSEPVLKRIVPEGVDAVDEDGHMERALVRASVPDWVDAGPETADVAAALAD